MIRPHPRSLWLVMLLSINMLQKHSIHRCFIASAFLSSSASSKSTFWPSSRILQPFLRQPHRGGLSWGTRRNILLQRRGGGTTNLMETSSSSSSSSSSSTASSTIVKSRSDVEMDVEQMAQATKSSILGGLVCRKFAGSVPYFDSSFHPNEFRVVFVLGGPGGEF